MPKQLLECAFWRQHSQDWWQYKHDGVEVWVNDCCIGKAGSKHTFGFACGFLLTSGVNTLRPGFCEACCWFLWRSTDPLTLDFLKIYKCLSFHSAKYSNEISAMRAPNLLCFSYFSFTSLSLHGGYRGRLDGSQAYGSVLKNCVHAENESLISTVEQRITSWVPTQN